MLNKAKDRNIWLTSGADKANGWKRLGEQKVTFSRSGQ